MTPDALKIATDILRELGMEDVARWVEHPESVRELLRHDPLVDDQRSEEIILECASCSAQCTGTGSYVDAPHDRTCPIAAAWRALGDPRGQDDIEWAHEEALAMRALTPEQCDEWNATGPFDYSATRCTKKPGHKGGHSFPGRSRQVSSGFKTVYGADE